MNWLFHHGFGRLTRNLLLPGLAALLLGGCSAGVTPDQQSYLRWPPAPEVPRIIHLQNFSEPAHLAIRGSLAQRLWRGLTGNADLPLQRPHGVTTDEQGRIYVVDKVTRAIHIFAPEHNRYQRLAVADSGLRTPIDIAVDAQRQRFFVSDAEAGQVTIFAQDNGRALGVIGNLELTRPTGLAINPQTDELLVVDSAQATIMRIDLATLQLKGHIGGQGDTQGLFNGPVAVAIGPQGRIHVVDSLNHRIQVFTADGEFILAFGSAGVAPGYFSRPKAIGVDSEGNIHVLDTLFDNIQIFDSTGRLLMVYGGPGQQPGQFWLPSGLFIDSADRIYVGDTYNDRVQIFQFLAGGELQ